MTVVDPGLPERIRAADPSGQSAHFDAAACMNCGVCTAVCPLGIEGLPRRLFHLVNLGVVEVLEQELETIYSCLLCRRCEARCPAEVRITENVRSLRNYINTTAFGL